MTAALTVRHPAEPRARREDEARGHVPVAGVALGDNLQPLLRAAIGGSAVRAARDPAGLVVAADSDARTSDAAVLQGLDGRPVGLVVVGVDVERAAACLARLRAEVVAGGGLPVGAGIWVDPIDARTDAAGELLDVTVHSSLALLGHRVHTLAWTRTALRA